MPNFLTVKIVTLKKVKIVIFGCFLKVFLLLLKNPLPKAKSMVQSKTDFLCKRLHPKNFQKSQ